MCIQKKKKSNLLIKPTVKCMLKMEFGCIPENQLHLGRKLNEISEQSVWRPLPSAEGGLGTVQSHIRRRMACALPSALRGRAPH